jgi:hypothetical protein
MVWGTASAPGTDLRRRMRTSDTGDAEGGRRKRDGKNLAGAKAMLPSEGRRCGRTSLMGTAALGSLSARSPVAVERERRRVEIGAKLHLDSLNLVVIAP